MESGQLTAIWWFKICLTHRTDHLRLVNGVNLSLKTHCSSFPITTDFNSFVTSSIKDSSEQKFRGHSKNLADSLIVAHCFLGRGLSNANESCTQLN